MHSLDLSLQPVLIQSVLTQTMRNTLLPNREALYYLRMKLEACRRDSGVPVSSQAMPRPI